MNFSSSRIATNTRLYYGPTVYWRLLIYLTFFYKVLLVTEKTESRNNSKLFSSNVLPRGLGSNPDNFQSYTSFPKDNQTSVRTPANLNARHLLCHGLAFSIFSSYTAWIEIANQTFKMWPIVFGETIFGKLIPNEDCSKKIKLSTNRRGHYYN